MAALAMAMAPSLVLFPPMNPAYSPNGGQECGGSRFVQRGMRTAWQKQQSAMPEILVRASSRTPHHGSGSPSRLVKPVPSTVTAC